MSILAGPRRKQRISIDPQNLNWSKDESKFGKKLMEKMGWESGKGLGKSGNGRTDNLKLKANTTGKGLGELASYDSTWIAHHDDFADLLSALNKNKPADEDKPADAEEKVRKISLELSSRSLKRRIHYQKFTRAKDITGYDDNAKKAVLGLGLTTRKNEEKTASGSSGDEQEKPTNEQTEEAIAAAESVKKLHTVSTVSVGDYFKDKMAARLAALKSASAATRSIKVEVEDTAEDYDEPAYTKVEEAEDYDEPANTEEDIVEEPRKKKKKSKKRDMDEAEESHEVEIKQEPEVEHKPKEKKRKRKHRDCEDEEPVVTNDVEEVPVEEVSEKRKKKKKRRDVEVVEYVEEVVEEYTESTTLVVSEVQSEDIAPVAEEGDETENLERQKKKKKKDKKNKRRNDEEDSEL